MSESTRVRNAGRQIWPWPALTVLGAVGLLTAVVVSATMNAEPNGPRTTSTDPTSPATTTITDSTVPAQPSTTLRHGLAEVGVDVFAGTYRTAGPIGAGNCYWSRYTAGGTRLLDNGVTGDAGTITLNSGELVETAGCQPWRLVT